MLAIRDEYELRDALSRSGYALPLRCRYELITLAFDVFHSAAAMPARRRRHCYEPPLLRDVAIDAYSARDC